MESPLNEDELKKVRAMLANSGGRFDWDGKVSAFWAWAKPFATLLAVGGLGYLGFTGKEAAKDAAAHAQTATAQSQVNAVMLDDAAKKVDVVAEEAKVIKTDLKKDRDAKGPPP